ncbi:hypothetical protein [Klebsiella phage phiKp_21]|nr:hypothetical protein DIDNDMLP_00388 [Klebsiella phage KP13-7]BEH88320.1 hypothetical protein [Klebsiella phage phiKp_21]
MNQHQDYKYHKLLDEFTENIKMYGVLKQIETKHKTGDYFNKRCNSIIKRFVTESNFIIKGK